MAGVCYSVLPVVSRFHAYGIRLDREIFAWHGFPQGVIRYLSSQMNINYVSPFDDHRYNMT